MNSEFYSILFNLLFIIFYIILLRFRYLSDRMSVKKVTNRPKQLIIDHYDSLVNKLDVYVEQLLKKYDDDDLLEECESRAKTYEDYKKSKFKIVDDDDEDEESEDEEEIEEDNSSSGSEEEEESDSDDGMSYLERKYMKKVDFNFEMAKKNASECEDSDECENEDEEEIGEDEKDKNKKEEDIEIDQEDKESEEEEEDIDIDDDLNNYSYYDNDEWDENVEDIEDEEVYELVIYGIIEFRDPYDFDCKLNRHSQFELKERSSIKTKDYLNQIRSFMIDEIRKAETQQLELYEANKAGFKFDKNSSIGQMKKEIFKDRFCFLIDTKTDQHHDLFNFATRQKKNRVFNLCLIITDFYLSTSQLNRIKYVAILSNLIIIKYNSL